jgi:hypothetical protein
MEANTSTPAAVGAASPAVISASSSVVVGLWGVAITQLPPRCAELIASEPITLVELGDPGHETIDVVLLWLDRHVGPGELEAIAAARRADAPEAALLCYAPAAGQPFCETALAAEIDDVMVGRSWPRELVSRIKALSRRARQTGPCTGYLRYGAVRLDAAQHRLWVDGSPIQLTPIETRLLAELMRAQGSPRSREELLATAWGDDSLETLDRAVDNAILRLRRKLGGVVITTVRGVGFRLERA